LIIYSCRAEDLHLLQASPALDHGLDLDPEELKDALLEQAHQQRREALAATLRGGSGRMPAQRQFRVVLRPLRLSPARPATSAPQQQTVGYAIDAQTRPPPPPQQGAAAYEVSQLAQLRTQGAPRFSPMEGVPERGPLRSASLMDRPSAWGNPSEGGALTPLEGVPERMGDGRVFPGATQLGSNRYGGIATREGGVGDSPVEGLIHQRAAGQRGQQALGDGPPPPLPPPAPAAAATGSFAFAGGADDDGDNGGDDYMDGGGGYDDDDYGGHGCASGCGV
jgi:hypothetical protein